VLRLVKVQNSSTKIVSHRKQTILVSRENYCFGVLGNISNYVRCLAVFLLQHKVTRVFRNVSSEERVEQTEYIGE